MRNDDGVAAVSLLAMPRQASSPPLDFPEKSPPRKPFDWVGGASTSTNITSGALTTRLPYEFLVTSAAAPSARATSPTISSRSARTPYGYLSGSGSPLSTRASMRLKRSSALRCASAMSVADHPHAVSLLSPPSGRVVVPVAFVQ